MVSGLIDGYDRGKFTHLELIMPSGDVEKFTTFGSEDSEFYTIIEIDRGYMIGMPVKCIISRAVNLYRL